MGMDQSIYMMKKIDGEDFKTNLYTTLMYYIWRRMKNKDVDEFYYLSDNLDLDMPNYFEDLRVEYRPELIELSYFGKNNYLFNEIKNIVGDVNNGKYYELKSEDLENIYNNLCSLLKDVAKDEEYKLRIAINELSYVIEVFNEDEYRDKYMCLYKFT